VLCATPPLPFSSAAGDLVGSPLDTTLVLETWWVRIADPDCTLEVEAVPRPDLDQRRLTGSIGVQDGAVTRRPGIEDVIALRGSCRRRRDVLDSILWPSRRALASRARNRWPRPTRVASCGVAETHVVDANADPDEAANHVLAAFRDGRLAVG
jgi:hypothetical protein